MRIRLVETFARLWTSCFGRRFSVVAKTEDFEKHGDWATARRRFWAEFREGRREAEAHISRPR